VSERSDQEHSSLNNRAIKNDNGKPPMGLLPWPALIEVTRVLNFGAQKYTKHNWRHGMDWSRLYDAALRHITSFIEGKNLDDETNLGHLSHALCCLLFLETYRILGLGTDDRYKGEV